MEARDSYGYIVNINSVVGHFVPEQRFLPTGVYCPTKYAITATSEIMRKELVRMKNHKVRVTSLSPGMVNTNIFKTAGVDEALEEKMIENSLNPEDIGETVAYLLSLPYTINITEITVRATGNAV